MRHSTRIIVHIVTALLAIIGILIAFASAGAQDTTRHSPKPNAVLIPVAALAGYGLGMLDRDAGGYVDNFKLHTDKFAHLTGSVIVGKVAGDHASKPVALLACLALGGAYELAQGRHHGYSSPYDFSYDAIGCGIGALWGRR